MGNQVKEHSVQKEYICRVRGHFPENEVVSEQPILVVNHKLGVCKVDPSGKECKTTFQLIRRDTRSSVVRCFPETGRMHQIRVHAQYLGFPILNDPVYNLEVLPGGQQGKPENWTVDTAVRRLTASLDSGDACGDTTENSKVHFVDWSGTTHYRADCSECQLKRPDPEAKDMLIFLHAVKYSGAGWEYTTAMPWWSAKNWEQSNSKKHKMATDKAL